MIPEPPALPITACIAEAWRAFWRNPWLGVSLFVLLLLMTCLQWALGTLPEELMPVEMAISLLFSPFIYGGTAAVARRMVEGPKADLSGLAFGISRWPQVMASIIVVMLAVALVMSPVIVMGVLITLGAAPSEVLMPLIGIGMIPLLPLAMWVGVRLSLVYYTLTDETPVGPLAAIRITWSMTRGRFWRLLGLQLLLALIQALGVLALLVGLLVTFPLIYLGQAAAYLRLRPVPPPALPASLYPESPPAPPSAPLAPAAEVPPGNS